MLNNPKRNSEDKKLRNGCTSVRGIGLRDAIKIRQMIKQSENTDIQPHMAR